jgi:hypothetical protein
MLRDADGFVVELLQMLGDTASAVSDVQVFMTVAHLAYRIRAVPFCR